MNITNENIQISLNRIDQNIYIVLLTLMIITIYQSWIMLENIYKICHKTPKISKCIFILMAIIFITIYTYIIYNCKIEYINL